MAKIPMALEEFEAMMTEAGFVDEHFGVREIGPLFNISMMTNLRESDTDRHLNMTFIEFLEAVARCADKFELMFLEDQFPNYKSKNPFKLDKKLECICLKLMQTFLPPKVFESVFKTYKDLVELELKSGLHFGLKK